MDMENMPQAAEKTEKKDKLDKKSHPTIKGSLTGEKLSQVFDILSKNKGFGSLVISDGVSEKCFYFTMGGLRVVASGVRELLPLETLLLNHGLITPEKLKEIREIKDEHLSLREHLVLHERIEEKAIDEVLKEQVRCELLNALFWDDVVFEFNIGAPPRKALDQTLNNHTLSFGIRDLILEVKKRVQKIQNVRSLIRSTRLVLEPTFPGRRKLESQGFDRQAETVFRTIESNPGCTVADLFKKIRLNETQIADILYQMLSAEEVRTVREKELTKKEELAKIRAMEEAIDRAISKILLHSKLAHAYTEQGEKEQAGHHYKKMAVVLEDNGRLPEACKALRQANEMSPNDVEALERLVGVLTGLGQTEDAARAALDLGNKYADMGLHSRGQSIINRLLGLKVQNLQLQKAMLDLMVRLGHSDGIVNLAKGLISRFRAQNMKDDLKNVYGKLRDAARICPAIVDRWAELIEKRATSIKKWLSIAGAALLLLGVSLASYEFSARLRLQRATEQSRQFIAQGNFDQALGALNRISDMPLTSAAVSARALSRQVEALKNDYTLLYSNYLQLEPGRHRTPEERASLLQKAEELEPQLHTDYYRNFLQSLIAWGRANAAG